MSKLTRTMLLLAGLLLGMPGWAATGPAPTENTNALADCLHLRNGDLLYGRLASIDPHSSLQWRRPDAPEMIEFKPRAVSQIDFPPGNTAARGAPGACKLIFANGDSMEGTLVSADRDAVTLDTWYAGRLRIPRAGLKSLAFTPRDPAVFDGITGLEGWTQGASAKAFNGEAGQWVYRNGAFYTDRQASIARDVNLPAMADIHFDLAWRGMLNLAVALYTDSMQPILLASKDAGPPFGGFYSLRFWNSILSLTPIRRNEPLRSLGDIMIQDLNTKNHAHIDIKVNKSAAQIALFFDGTLVKQWIDPAGFGGEGTGLRFVENPGGALKLSNLRVTKWNGVLDEDNGVAPELAHDQVTLETGAKISGSVQRMNDGQIWLLSTNGTISLPMSKSAAVEFAHPRAESVVYEGATVKATFSRGGTIAGQLLSWTPEAMVLSSPDFGQVTFNPAVFSRLQFIGPEPKGREKS